VNIAAGIAKLRAVFDKLAALASGRKLPAATEKQVLDFVRRRFSEDIGKNFSESRDPDGNAWKPLRWRTGKPLILTGALLAAAVSSVQNARWTGAGRIGFGITGEPRYWQYQNYGTSRIPARRFYFPRQDTLGELAGLIADAIGFEILRENRGAV
jgi:phage gpG-like protein